MSKLSQYLKDYYYISKSQRNAIVLLCGWLIIVIALYFSLPFLLNNDSIAPDLNFVKNVKEFESSRVNLPKSSFSLFYFDPNVLEKDGWISMGLSEKLASNIVNYRNAGGKFREKGDLRKVYNMTDSLFSILEPFIIIQPDTKNESSTDDRQNVTAALFPFDPNSLVDESWKKLGFRDQQIANIRNYQKAGGKFSVKEDLKKLYTISEQEFERVKTFILLPDSITGRAVKSAGTSNQIINAALISVEINSADTAQLNLLKGVGPAFSNRIIKYRDKLGGFFCKEQLLEVIGIDTLRFKGFESQILVDVNRIRKIDLNTIEFKELVKHPYLEYYIVKNIFTYKDSKGRFNSVEELKKVDLIYDQLYEKIKWYFYVTAKNK